MRSTVAAIITLLFALTLPATAAAQLHMPERNSGAELPLPSVVDREALDALARQVAPSVLAVRTFTDLGENFRPRHAEGSGAATWVALRPDESPVLLTAFAHVAQADRVEVRLGDEWVEAEVKHGTPMFDLAELVLDASHAATLAELPPLELAARWSMGGTVYSPTDRTADTDPDVVIGAIGAPPEDYEYYVRALFTQHNGYPVVSIRGDVLAITSILVGDRSGGSLAIPFGHITTWREEWPQLETDSPIGWEPRVRSVPLEIDTGREEEEP